MKINQENVRDTLVILSSTECSPVQQRGAVDVKVLGVVRGIVRAEVSISSIASAMASEFEGLEVPKLFTAGLCVGRDEGRTEIVLLSCSGTPNVVISSI